MNPHRISFEGALLKRGFWLYIWRIKHSDNTFYYVGRTGDSSSGYAASPFSRLTRHLDTRENATANTLFRHIKQRGLDPFSCSFDMTAIGPLYKEQRNLEEHRKLRDRVARLESALASYLRQKGLDVVGDHSSSNGAGEELLLKIRSLIDKVI